MSKKMVMAVVMVAVFLASSLMFVIPTGEGDADTTGLPSGYTELEYIQSTGTQYIDTGYVFNSDNYNTLKIEVRANYIKQSVNTAEFLNMGLFVGVKTIGNYYAYCGGPNTMAVGTYDGKGHTFLLDGHNHTIYNDGISYVSSGVPKSLNQRNIYLFACNDAEIGASYHTTQKSYYYKIWDNNTLVRNFIPCIRKSDSKPGMYDTVTDQFFTNSATSGADFIAGPVVSRTKLYRLIRG